MKKIFIGPANLANISSHLAESLNSVGLKTDFISWSNNVNPFDYGRNKTYKIINNPPFKLFGKNIFYFINEYLLKPIYFLLSIVKYGVFFFITPTTFLRKNFDLKILKLFGKKIVIICAGCVDRNPKFEDHPEYICNLCTDTDLQKKCLCFDIDKKKGRINYFEKFADYIIGPPDTLSFVSDKNKTRKYLAGIGPIKISAKEKNFNGKIIISHLPSNPLVKGTDLIIPVLNRIKAEENTEVIIKDGIWSREKILNTLSKTHILIDSLARYIFGIISLEAIQYGCVVLNAYPEWIEKNYEIPPVVDVNSETLYQTLLCLIKDRELLKFYAERSQSAYQKYFDYKVAGGYYKELLEN